MRYTFSGTATISFVQFICCEQLVCFVVNKLKNYLSEISLFICIGSGGQSINFNVSVCLQVKF